MNRWCTRLALLFGTLSLLLLLMMGCSGDSTTEPNVDPPTKGTIVVDLAPTNLSVPWTLSGPGSYSYQNTGSRTLTDLAPGEYTLVCTEVSGYVTPANSTQTLVAGNTVTFSNTYVVAIDVGTIIIDQTPSVMAAADWTLTGPRNETGAGDTELINMPIGEYTLTWSVLAGYLTPPSSSQTLVDGDDLTFESVYYQDPESVAGFILIPPEIEPIPATFTMGTEDWAAEAAHQVTLTNRFTMSETEVTNAQFVEALNWANGEGHLRISDTSVYDVLDGTNTEIFDLDGIGVQIFYRSSGQFDTFYPDRPVVSVSWHGAVAYCDWLNIRSDLPMGYDHSTWTCTSDTPYDVIGYRLPTEAEWEFACRAGSTTLFYTGDCLDAGTEANYRGTSPYVNCPFGTDLGRSDNVGDYPANDWGLFDMHGNVFEWCLDYYADYAGDETNPVGPGTGDVRVVRGGDWFFPAGYCRSSFRHSDIPGMVVYGYGFRVVRTVVNQ